MKIEKWNEIRENAIENYNKLPGDGRPLSDEDIMTAFEGQEALEVEPAIYYARNLEVTIETKEPERVFRRFQRIMMARFREVFVSDGEGDIYYVIFHLREDGNLSKRFHFVADLPFGWTFLGFKHQMRRRLHMALSWESVRNRLKIRPYVGFFQEADLFNEIRPSSWIGVLLLPITVAFFVVCLPYFLFKRRKSQECPTGSEMCSHSLETLELEGIEEITKWAEEVMVDFEKVYQSSLMSLNHGLSGEHGVNRRAAPSGSAPI